jgi:hypothetical protein
MGKALLVYDLQPLDIIYGTLKKTKTSQNNLRGPVYLSLNYVSIKKEA